MQFSLTNPDIATTVVGSANPKDMERNIAWADEAVDQAMLQEVLTILKPVHNLTWASGRGENN